MPDCSRISKSGEGRGGGGHGCRLYNRDELSHQIQITLIGVPNIRSFSNTSSINLNRHLFTSMNQLNRRLCTSMNQLNRHLFKQVPAPARKHVTMGEKNHTPAAATSGVKDSFKPRSSLRQSTARPTTPAATLKPSSPHKATPKPVQQPSPDHLSASARSTFTVPLQGGTPPTPAPGTPAAYGGTDGGANAHEGAAAGSPPAAEIPLRIGGGGPAEGEAVKVARSSRSSGLWGTNARQSGRIIQQTSYNNRAHSSFWYG
jgi:hypothetical protein